VLAKADGMMQLLKERGVPAHRLGAIGGDELSIASAGETLRWLLGEVHDDWFDAVANALKTEPTTS
jgi:hypothetical protein